MKIALDLSLAKTHRARGIGIYAQKLATYLPKIDKLHQYVLALNQPQLATTDLIHFPSFDFFYLTLPHKKTNKWIVTIHDTIPLIFPDQFPPGIRGKIKFIIQNHLLHQAEAIITDSQNSKRDIIKYLNLPESKIHVIYLGVEKVFKPITSVGILNQTLKKHHLHQPFILYIGDVNYNKNLPVLLEAFTLIPKPELELVLISRTWKEKIPEVIALKNKIEDLKLTSRIKIIDTVISPKELIHIYNLASVYIQPSLYEGFGLPVLEAMACGTPVVATKVASLPEICGQAAIQVKPEVGDMAAGIKQVLAFNQKQRQSTAKAGISQAAKFTWEKTAQETIRVYNKVLDRK